MGLARIGITSAPSLSEGRRTDAAARDHVEAVVAAGGLPVIIPELAPALLDPVLETVDGLLVPGGGDEVALVRSALAAGLPVLGVGAGHQVVNLALGGTLGPRPPAPEAGAGPVRIAAGSLLAAVVGTTSLDAPIGRHRPLDGAGAGLQVVARSADGHVGAVEGLGDLRVLAVRWQAELLLHEPAHAALFAWLVQEAAVHPDAAVIDLVRADEVGPVPPSSAVGATFG